MIELLRDVLPERVPSTPRTDAPATPVVWVRPQQVAYRAFVGRLLHPVQLPDLVQRVDAGRETAVQAEDVVLDDSSERQIVEEAGEILPDISIAILAKALVIEAIGPVYRAALVVSTKEVELIWILDLVG